MYLLNYAFFFLILLKVSLGQTWEEVSTDPTGDGSNASLLDGTKLEYSYDEVTDSLWFRVAVANLNSSNLSALGINIMFNIPGGGTTFNFWGTDNMNPFHKLLTTWVSGTHPSNYSGTIGICDAAGVGAMNYTNLKSNNIFIKVDSANQNIILGVKRVDIVSDLDITEDSIKIGIAAAVGSDMFWNDDIYSASAEIVIIPVKPDIIAPVVSNITMSDVGDSSNGSDLEISFDKVSDETKIGEYGIIVVRSVVADSFSLIDAEMISLSNYTLVAKTGNNITQRLSHDAKDSDGALITTDVEYNVFVLSVADGDNANINAITSASETITLKSSSISNIEDTDIFHFEILRSEAGFRIKNKGANDIEKICIYRISGQEVLTYQVKEKTISYNIPISLEQGLYLVKIKTTQNGILTLKHVIL